MQSTSISLLASLNPADAVLPDVFDRYAADIIRGREELFGSIEIHGVRNSREGDPCIVVIDDHDPDFFTVYVRTRCGCMVESVGDFSWQHDAQSYASELATRHRWQVSDFTTRQMLQVQPAPTLLCAAGAGHG